MQITSLKVFCDVSRLRSFSQAAQANDITQSAVSQTVSQLERLMGVKLIDRSTRPLQLTSAGQTYFEGCKAMLEQYTELEMRTRAAQFSAQAAVSGTVQVAAIYSVGLSDMGQYVDRFAALYPQAQVHLDYLHPDQVYERVLNGTADLGLVSFPKSSSKLAALAWRDEEMVLACSPHNPLASKLSVRRDDLQDRKYVHYEKGLMIRKKIDRFLREQGINVDVALEFDNIENIKHAVALDVGVALLPEPTFRREVEAGTLVALPLADCRMVRPLGVIHRRKLGLSSAARPFLDLLLDRGVNGVDRGSWTVDRESHGSRFTAHGPGPTGNGSRPTPHGPRSTGNGTQSTAPRES